MLLCPRAMVKCPKKRIVTLRDQSFTVGTCEGNGFVSHGFWNKMFCTKQAPMSQSSLTQGELR